VLWHAILIPLFVVRGVQELLYVVRDPSLIGSHGIIYTDAARAWLTGANPWSTGPDGAVFAGPPTMLLPFAPFAFLPGEVVRYVWLIGMLAVAVWAVWRLRLPPYWLAFPPIFGAIVLGHPEVLVLALLTLRGRIGGPLSGLAAIVKPYAVGALAAERRWLAFAVAAAVFLATALFLPWALFFDELPAIGRVVAEQSHGDSVFGDPLLMLVAGLALLALGPRRALWLATPVLWPSAQPIYKVGAVPAMSRLLAIFWAVPIPGATLAGVVVEAAVVLAGRRWRLPEWLRVGVEPIGFASLDRKDRAPATASEPATMGA
jgi:hypothetical protein